MVASQQKNCVPVGMTIIRVAAVKKLSLICGNAGGEHVMNPNAKSQKASGDDGQNDRRVPKYMAARINGHERGHDGGTGKKNDVDLGMPEEPEQVLIKKSVPAFGGIKELGAN